MNKTAVIVIAIFIIIFPSIADQDFSVSPPPLLSRSVILIDVATNDVLYEKDADLEIPPASMTKLMTLHVIYNLIEAGIIGYQDIVPVSEMADWRNLPGMSSNMRLESGQWITLKELMLGLAVSSGNDAAIALAEYAGGTVESFVQMMNDEARKLGFDLLHFADPSGLSAENRVTARQFADFCKIYVSENPQALTELHGVPDFTYPMPHNGPTSLSKPKTKKNTNLLIGRYEGIDGLKTGYIDESGYNIAVTAEREGRRLLAVLMGAPGTLVGIDGLVNRAMDAALLLDYGFYSTTHYTPAPPVLGMIPVYKGHTQSLSLVIDEVELLTIERWKASAIQWEIDIPTGVIGPVSEGEILGSAVLKFEDEIIAEYAVKSGAEVQSTGFWGRFADSFSLLFKNKEGFYQAE